MFRGDNTARRCSCQLYFFVDLNRVMCYRGYSTSRRREGFVLSVSMNLELGCALGSVAGGEAVNLLLNGGFDTDTIWTKGANTTISGGTANCTDGGGNTTQQVTIPAAGAYTFEFEVTAVSVSNIGISHVVGTATISDVGTFTSRGTVGLLQRTYTFSSGGTFSVSMNPFPTFVGSVDNASLRAV